MYLKRLARRVGQVLFVVVFIPLLATVTVAVGNFFFSPATVTTIQGDTVQWNFSGFPHTVTDASGMGRFDSGDKLAGQSFSLKFDAAGTYPYLCKNHPASMKGSVQVPVKATPGSGFTNTIFTVIWSAAAPPAGYVFDVQIQRPGVSTFGSWKTGQTATSTTFTPDAGAGIYAFRSRLRNTANDKASSYSPGKSITVMVKVQDFFFAPATVRARQGTRITWRFTGAASHTVSDNTGMQLYDSGTRGLGSTFANTFTAAGGYVYICHIHSSMTGSVQVPARVSPVSGTTSTTFTIYRASISAPVGSVYDVQIKRPGAASFVNWQIGQTTPSATFTPDAGAGTYQFRARLRKTSGGAASYSPAATITVQ